MHMYNVLIRKEYIHVTAGCAAALLFFVNVL